MTPEEFKLAPGILIDGRHRLLSELGVGGHAAVWRALDEFLDREVAWKALLPKHLMNAEVLDRFEREGRLYARLDHPNIVKILDMKTQPGQALGWHYLVMDLAEETLEARLIRDPQLTIDERLDIAIQILAALEHAHDRHIVHRDLKPSNLLLRKGIVLLTDFGVAHDQLRQVRLTSGEARIGTLDYMSPEQHEGASAKVTPQSDIYSFGCILFEMLCGRPPFTSGSHSSFDVIDGHLRQPPPRPRELNSSLTPRIESVILRCLEKDPAQRYQSARELSAALRAVRLEAQRNKTIVEPLPLPKPKPKEEPPSPVPLKRLWLGAVAALLFVILASYGYHLYKEEQKKQEEISRLARQDRERRAMEEKARQERERAAQIERERKAAEPREIQEAARLSDEYAAKFTAWKQQYCPNCNRVIVKNECPNKTVSLALYLKLPDDTWGTVGWWRIAPMTSVSPNVVSLNSYFYYYAFVPDTAIEWNGIGKSGAPDDGSLEQTVVSNRFFRIGTQPALGNNKRTVRMFRRRYEAWGEHELKLTCTSVPQR
jgi:serine/threonine protein kinase